MPLLLAFPLTEVPHLVILPPAILMGLGVMETGTERSQTDTGTETGETGGAVEAEAETGDGVGPETEAVTMTGSGTTTETGGGTGTVRETGIERIAIARSKRRKGVAVVADQGVQDTRRVKRTRRREVIVTSEKVVIRQLKLKRSLKTKNKSSDFCTVKLNPDNTSFVASRFELKKICKIKLMHAFFLV